MSQQLNGGDIGKHTLIPFRYFFPRSVSSSIDIWLDYIVIILCVCVRLWVSDMLIWLNTTPVSWDSTGVDYIDGVKERI